MNSFSISTNGLFSKFPYETLHRSFSKLYKLYLFCFFIFGFFATKPFLRRWRRQLVAGNHRNLSIRSHSNFLAEEFDGRIFTFLHFLGDQTDRKNARENSQLFFFSNFYFGILFSVFVGTKRSVSFMFLIRLNEEVDATSAHPFNSQPHVYVALRFSFLFLSKF